MFFRRAQWRSCAPAVAEMRKRKRVADERVHEVAAACPDEGRESPLDPLAAACPDAEAGGEVAKDRVEAYGFFLEDRLKPQRHKESVACDAVKKLVQAVLIKKEPLANGYRFKVFGSRYYGTALPASDMDLVCLMGP